MAKQRNHYLQEKMFLAQTEKKELSGASDPIGRLSNEKKDISIGTWRSFHYRHREVPRTAYSKVVKVTLYCRGLMAKVGGSTRYICFQFHTADA